jgi:hypothetical protein
MLIVLFITMCRGERACGYRLGGKACPWQRAHLGSSPGCRIRPLLQSGVGENPQIKKITMCRELTFQVHFLVNCFAKKCSTA